MSIPPSLPCSLGISSIFRRPHCFICRPFLPVFFLKRSFLLSRRRLLLLPAISTNTKLLGKWKRPVVDSVCKSWTTAGGRSDSVGFLSHKADFFSVKFRLRQLRDVFQIVRLDSCRRRFCSVLPIIKKLEDFSYRILIRRVNICVFGTYSFPIYQRRLSGGSGVDAGILFTCP